MHQFLRVVLDCVSQLSNLQSVVGHSYITTKQDLIFFLNKMSNAICIFSQEPRHK